MDRKTYVVELWDYYGETRLFWTGCVMGSVSSRKADAFRFDTEAEAEARAEKLRIKHPGEAGYTKVRVLS